MSDDLEKAVLKWKKEVRDRGKPLSYTGKSMGYADSFREGWRKCEENQKARKRGKQ